MPKLIKEYKEAGNKKIPFDKDKIRNLARDNPPGFATQGWDETLLQTEIDDLVKKGLIENLEGGKHQISDLGLKWKDDNDPPVLH